MTIGEFRNNNPGVFVGEGKGKWLVVYCRGVGVWYESYFKAHAEALEVCAYCPGHKLASHPIHEISVPVAASPVKLKMYHEKGD